MKILLVFFIAIRFIECFVLFLKISRRSTKFCNYSNSYLHRLYAARARARAEVPRGRYSPEQWMHNLPNILHLNRFTDPREMRFRK